MSFPIIAIYEDPDTPGEYFYADPYVLYATFKYQGMKIRSSIRVNDNKFKIGLKIDRKRMQPRLISVSRFLRCIEGNYIAEDGKIYVTTDTIIMFLEEIARTYCIRTFNLPFQMTLPLYESILPSESETELTHPP